MHETLSNNFKGRIDKTETVNGKVTVTAWAATKDSYAYNEVKVVNNKSKQEIPSAAFLKERPDVYSFYQNSDPSYLLSGLVIEFPVQQNDVTVIIKDEPVFTIVGNKYSGTPLEDIIQLNPNTKPELIVVDNFYKDPDKVRDYALAQEFKANEAYHKGSRTEKTYIPNWVQGEFSRLLNRPVTAFVGATGVFQYCVAKDNVVYHYDTQEYAGMVYLSPDAPLQTGTQTYRSKLTGMFAAATDEDAKRLGKTKEEIDTLSFNGNNFYDRHNMELVDSVANVYNRLVIFNARALHAATSYYGSNKDNGRLFHLYFFNC